MRARQRKIRGNIDYRTALVQHRAFTVVGSLMWGLFFAVMVLCIDLSIIVSILRSSLFTITNGMHQGFDAELFDISSPTLRSQQPSLIASPKLVHDLNSKHNTYRWQRSH